MAAVMLALTGSSPGSWAHESRPALLQIEELQTQVYGVLWKVPVRNGAVPDITPRFPDHCVVDSASEIRQFADAMVSHAIVKCPQAGLWGQRIMIEGLETTILETVVRYRQYQSPWITILLSAQQPSAVISSTSVTSINAGAYFRLGVRHILSGPDHLLFLLGLLLIISGVRDIAIAITGFTMAHGTALFASTLGLVPPAGGLVESLIALSVLVLAAEALRAATGHRSLISNYPFTLVFVFGLLHGLGFAGALAETGLPESDRLRSLLNFNVGIEVGQLIFVAACLILLSAISHVTFFSQSAIRSTTGYLMGSIAAYWLITRTAGHFCPVLS